MNSLGKALIIKSLNSMAADILKKGGVGVLPTDTIYGLVGSALNRKTVERIYKIRRRDKNKPMIILIGSLNDLKPFGIKLNKKQAAIIKKFWPGKVSIIIPCLSKRFFYIHRGANSLAFRLPAKRILRSFLGKTGPLVAPSANISRRPPAKNIKEAKKYFGDKIDFYIDVGDIRGTPSKIIKIEKNKVVIIRK